MAERKLRPSKHVKEKVEIEEFVKSEVKEEIFKDGVNTGANITLRAQAFLAIILVFLLIVIAFMAIPGWQPYLPEFFSWLGKVFEAFAKALK